MTAQTEKLQSFTKPSLITLVQIERKAYKKLEKQYADLSESNRGNMTACDRLQKDLDRSFTQMSMLKLAATGSQQAYEELHEMLLISEAELNSTTAKVKRISAVASKLAIYYARQLGAEV